MIKLIALLSVGSASAGGNPVSRVATLLQNLASKIDAELDTESKLYEDYVCWAKTVVSTKTASNEKAQSRADSLKTYLADLDAGRIELTSERSDLEKEVNGLTSDLETAANLRNKEHSDYEAATNEMSLAIKSLNTAVKVLHEATKESKSSLVSLRAHLSQEALAGETEGFSARLAEADELERAVKVGSRLLKSSDALFLRRLLSGEVPQADWKKLNRKADFKMKYKARSVKIQDTLTKLLQSFKDNKEDADEKEKKASDVYESLKKAKESQLNAAQESLTKQDVEGGAAAVSKSDAKAEVSALETQIKDDEKYISETETALDRKKKEFEERKGLRVGEIKAINEAIAVIHSDDARDLMKRSMSFLQVDSATATASAQAMVVLKNTARTTGDERLSALVQRLGSGAKFDKVLSAVTKMIKTLEDEDDSDLSNKEDCEKERMADTKEAATLSRTIDELSDDVSKLQGEIEQINKQVDEKDQSVKDLNKEMKDATKIREDENREWKQSNSDDAATITLLQQSANVLKSFYKKNFAMVQAKNTVQAAPHVAGEAPPPPPQTWGGAYGGAKTESNGIISILDLLKKDVEKDQAAGKAAEESAQKDHEKFVKESESSVKNLQSAINELQMSKGKKEKDIQSKKATSGTKKGSLDSVLDKMKKAAPSCDFLLVNFKVRAANRKLEIDGLNNAKTILKAQNK